MNEKICRLCLQTISKNNCQAVAESLVKTLKLNLKITKETVMCFECAHSLQIFSKFTSGRVYVDETLPLSDLQNDVQLDTVKIEVTSNLAASLVKAEIKCSFCTEIYGRVDLVPLNESIEYKFLMNMLDILETNSKNDEELLTCETCLDALQGVLSFISNYLKVEEKISEYIGMEGTDDKGQIELKEVQQFMFRPILKLDESGKLKEKYNQIQEDTMMVEANIKHEKEISHPEFIIKTEYADIKLEETDPDAPNIKSEQRECDGFQESVIDNNILNDSLHMFKCELCSYDTKGNSNLKMHLLTHKRPFEINMFKCELCSFETKRKSSLKIHLLIHQSPVKVKMFKCEWCSYETKRKSNLKMHLLTHKSPFEINMFKCELCSFETKRKCSLNIHLLTHQSPLKVKMFKCELCLYETKHKSSLKMHLLTHKSPFEINMFKCELCSYESKRKFALKVHLLTHQSPSELQTFKCELCSYEAKQKVHLRKHLLTHMDPSKIEAFRCKLCSYETKHKHNLERHLLSHKRTSELKKCELCSYTTKCNSNLTKHLLTHKNPLEMFKCEMCSYMTKQKNHLRTHVLIHMDPSKIKMFKCKLCSYEGKRKYHLKRHLLTHKILPS